MAILTKQQIDQRMAKLPEKLNDALFDFDNISLMDDVQANFRLSDDQTSNLSKIVGRVLMGFIIVDSLVGKIASSLKIDQPTSQQIANVLNKKIFNPLKTDIESFRKQINATENKPENILDLKKVVTQKASPLPPKKVTPSTPTPGLNRTEVMPQTTAPKPLEQMTTPAPAPIINQAPTPQAPIQKDFTRNSAPASPFIIHQESEVRPIAPEIPMETNIPEMSSRAPSENKAPESVRAKVEIGETYRQQKHENKTTPAFTKRQDHKVVNFGASSPKIKDPFSNIGQDKKGDGPRVEGNTVDLRK